MQISCFSLVLIKGMFINLPLVRLVFLRLIAHRLEIALLLPYLWIAR